MTEDEKEKTIEEIQEAKVEKPKTAQKQVDNGFISLIEALGPIATLYMTYKEKESDSKIKYFQQASKHNRNVLYAMTVFLIGVIAFMSFLTWIDKVSGDALLFLVGTVVGYLILFIQRLASPTQEQPIEEVE